MRIVLKLGGNVILDPPSVAAVAQEAKALRAAGCDVILVHGGGPQLDDALAKLGEPLLKLDGLRVTSSQAAHVVRTVMDGIGLQLARQLAQHGLPAHHVPSGGFEAVAKATPPGVGRVGTVTRFIARLPDGVPVVTPVGHDLEGPLNVNADEGACAVAAAVKAQWLVLGTDVSAVRGETGEPVHLLTREEALRLVASKTATGGMIPKLGSAVAALGAGVGTVLITKITPGILVAAVLAGRPVGTLVH